MILYMYQNSVILIYVLYKSKSLTLRTIGHSWYVLLILLCVYGPKWPFYSCDDILDCLGQVYTCIVFG